MSTMSITVVCYLSSPWLADMQYRNAAEAKLELASRQQYRHAATAKLELASRQQYRNAATAKLELASR